MSGMPGRLVLIGHPVSHSLSPVFQNAALAAAGIELIYEPVDVAPGELRELFERLRADGAAGNVTVPHKEAVFALCDDLTNEARRVGAVNAFKVAAGRAIGHNTDVQGVDEAMRSLLGEAPRDAIVGVIGAGGAAAAVLAAVEQWSGCSALVSNRGAGRLHALMARFGSVARGSDGGEIARSADILVNATSLGLRPADELPIDPGMLRADCAVLDLVYSPSETALVRKARDRGLRAADGLSMLVAQGTAAFAWWFDRAPDVEVMWRSLGRPRPSP